MALLTLVNTLDARVKGTVAEGMGAKMMKSGLDDARVIDAAAEGEVVEFTALVAERGVLELRGMDLGPVEDFLEGVRRLARMARSREAACSNPGLEDAVWEAKASQERERARAAGDQAGFLPAVALPAAGRRAGGAPKRRRVGTGVAGMSARDLKLRGKALTALERALLEAGAPVLGEMREGEDREVFFASLLGSSRPSTALLRLRVWGPFAEWMWQSLGIRWPRGVRDVTDYIRYQVAVAAPPSWPARFAGTLAWIEGRAGVAVKVGGADLVRRSLDWATKELAVDGAVVKKAPRLPVVAIVALEAAVMDREAPCGLRIGAWCRLLKVFGTMRWDDLQRLRPSNVVLREAGLTGRLLQTKTTGVGRKVRELPLFIPKEAWVSCEKWLKEGYYLWKKFGPADRDYFLMCPEVGLGGFLERPASYEDANVLSWQVMASLRVPVPSEKADQIFEKGSDLLFPGELASGWTNHSERATVPSASAALGVDKDRRNLLGRWGPDGSDDYVRTYRAAVKELLNLFVGVVRSGAAYEKLDEEEAVETAAARALKIWEGELADSGAVAAVRNVQTIAKEVLASYAEGDPKPLEEGCFKELVQTGAGEDAGDDLEEPAKYIIVYTRGGKTARLHKAMGCWRSKTLAFLDYELVDSEVPPADRYNDFCRQCWPGKDSGDLSDESSSSADGSSSGSSVSEEVIWS